MRVLLALVLLVSVTVRPAQAQAGLPGPFVDVGVDFLATASSSASGVAWSPRLTLNPTPDLAVAFRGAVVTDDNAPFRRRATTVAAEMRHRLAYAGPIAVDAIAGVGFRHTRQSRPEYGPRPGPGGVQLGVISDHLDTDTPLGVFGAGIVERLGSRAELRQDFRIAAHSEGFDATVTAGVTVPVGRYAARRAGQSVQIGSARVRTGQRIWVTTHDGRTLDGYVGDVSSSSIEVVQRSGRASVDMARVRRVETPDSVRDGVTRGALAGAAGVGVFGGIVSTAICECHDAQAALVTMTFAGLGAGTGALIGGIIDSFHVGRQTIFGQTKDGTLTIAPLVTPSHLGAAAAIRW
jgi:hypothetical protein